MADTDIPAPAELALASPTAPSRDRRQSTWTCRLPAKLMMKICMEVRQQRDLSTLSNIQRTSSHLYTFVTPHLYRHFKLNQTTAILFFRLFTPRRPSHIRFFFTPVPAHSHLLDLHMVYRLRSFLSYTITFTFTILEGPQPVPKDYIETLENYKDLAGGLSIFNAPTLWPNLVRTLI